MRSRSKTRAKISYPKNQRRKKTRSLNRWVLAKVKVVGAKVFKNAGNGQYLIKVVNKRKSLYYTTYANFLKKRVAKTYLR